MIDRTFKLLVLSLGVLLILLLGLFVATLIEEHQSPVPELSRAPAPRVEAAPPKIDQNSNDLVTKRVKTIVVRPEEPLLTPRNP